LLITSLERAHHTWSREDQSSWSSFPRTQLSMPE
jgi:hypothetical protein